MTWKTMVFSKQSNDIERFQSMNRGWIVVVDVIYHISDNSSQSEIVSAEVFHCKM
jgi:hypothetical protein